MVTLYQGDCLQEMDKIADGSIDLILTDLPYGTVACSWDVVIPFEPLWKQYRRVIKPGGAIVLTACQPFTSALVMSNPKMFRYSWIYQKSNATGHLLARKRPLRVHEDVLVFCDRGASYYPQMVAGAPFVQQYPSGPKPDYYGAKDSKPYFRVNEGSRYPRTIQRFQSERTRAHPAQKPVALMEYMIHTYTTEGETVLDSTMGSGTTGVAAVRTGRRFVGIEKLEQYFCIAQARIAAASAEMLEGLT